jgi:hypothetical protein
MAKRPSSVERAIKRASDAYNADIYFYSGPIDDDGLGQVVENITLHKQKDNAVLILTLGAAPPMRAIKSRVSSKRPMKSSTYALPAFVRVRAL